MPNAPQSAAEGLTAGTARFRPRSGSIRGVATTNGRNAIANGPSPCSMALMAMNCPAQIRLTTTRMTVSPSSAAAIAWNKGSSPCNNSSAQDIAGKVQTAPPSKLAG